MSFMKGLYVPFAYPSVNDFVNYMNEIEKLGFDFVEIGLPFSEPVADGPVIASAMEKMLQDGVTARGLLQLKDFLLQKRTKMDLYIMTYANVILSYGASQFSTDFGSFIQGLIIADLPNREHQFLQSEGLTIPLIPFVTPESRLEDLTKIENIATPFVYYVGVRGITGDALAPDPQATDLKSRVEFIKANLPQQKIVVGFGLKNRSDCEAVGSFADGVVIGTAAVAVQTQPEQYLSYIRSLI
jgi:tryptophan synthase alpha chain